MLLVCGHGRRRARPTRAGFGRAAAQHPDAGRAGRRHVRELRERQLLPYEFTLTFARIEHEVEEGDVPGAVVARVNASPRFIPELIAALAGFVVEVRDARGHPEPARGAGPLGRRPGRELTLSFVPSYAVLCAVQAATVAAPARQARPFGRSWVWLAVPAVLLGGGVLIIDTVPQGPHALARWRPSERRCSPPRAGSARAAAAGGSGRRPQSGSGSWPGWRAASSATQRARR